MLVNKRIKELLQFASKEVSRAQLNKILVTESEIVATDSHILAIMPVDTELSDNDYPAGTVIDTELAAPLVLTTDQIETALNILPKKPQLPMLNNIQIGTADGAPVVNAGLPAIQVPGNPQEDNETYPNYKQVIPDYDAAPAIKVALSGEYLKKLAMLAAKCNKVTKQVTFTIPTETEHVKGGVLWEIKDYDGEIAFHGILMPLRLD